MWICLVAEFVYLTIWVSILGGSGVGGSADGACPADDIECAEHDRLGMEAIRSLHQQLDDDDNGNIDLSESDDVSIFLYTHTQHFFPLRFFHLILVFKVFSANFNSQKYLKIQTKRVSLVQEKRNVGFGCARGLVWRKSLKNHYHIILEKSVSRALDYWDQNNISDQWLMVESNEPNFK